MIKVTILRNQAPSYSIFLTKFSDFKAVGLTFRDEFENKRCVWEFLLNENLLGCFSGFSRVFCLNVVKFKVLGVTQSNLGSFRVSGFSVTATHLVNSLQVFYHYNINAGTIFTETVQTKKIELSVLTLCFTLEFLCPHVPTENYYILM